MQSGGAERATSILSNYWASNGNKVTIITLSSKLLDFYDLNPSVDRISLNVYGTRTSFFNGILSNVRRVFLLRKTLSNNAPCNVISMMAGSNILLGIAAMGKKNIFIIGAERCFPPAYPLGFIREKLRKIIYSHFGAIVSQTDKVALWLKLHTNARNVVVIPNAITWPLLKTSSESKVPYTKDGQKMLLAAGRLVEEKQFDLLIHVFEELLQKFSDWYLVIVGEGYEHKKLVRLINLLGITDHVFMPGVVGNIGEWYTQADLFVMTSRHEGFPNVLVEAMSHGCPVVSFDCDTGPREIIRNNENGLLVKNGDIFALKKALSKLMSDDCLRLKLSQSAVKIKEKFAINIVAKSWENIFRHF